MGRFPGPNVSIESRRDFPEYNALGYDEESFPQTLVGSPESGMLTAERILIDFGKVDLSKIGL